jgi:hypothetical protein
VVRGNLARPVLRGPGRSNAPRLPDELYFSALARAVIRYGDFTSRDDLINKIETYVMTKNETAKPYRWTYDGTPLKAS